MSEKPILFSGEMVRAILEGRKTQTRRVIKVQPRLIDGLWHVLYGDWDAGHGIYESEAEMLEEYSRVVKCPYGKPGDRLWVRESFGWGPVGKGEVIVYRASHYGPMHNKWRPSIHMPREASRITLEITNVRVERLQDISEADAKAEGIDPRVPDNLHTDMRYRAPFKCLWEKINGKKHPWASNPWVWVVEFKKI